MQRLFPQPTEYLAPISENEQILLDKWKTNQLTNEQKNKIKVTILTYAVASTTAFGFLGVYLINSLVKDFEAQAISKMENEMQTITDKIKRADFHYTRTTEISNQMLKIAKYKSPVQVICTLMGVAYGLAQVRLYLRDEADKNNL